MAKVAGLLRVKGAPLQGLILMWVAIVCLAAVPEGAEPAASAHDVPQPVGGAPHIAGEEDPRTAGSSVAREEEPADDTHATQRHSGGAGGNHVDAAPLKPSQGTELGEGEQAPKKEDAGEGKDTSSSWDATETDAAGSDAVPAESKDKDVGEDEEAATHANAAPEKRKTVSDGKEDAQLGEGKTEDDDQEAHTEARQNDDDNASTAAKDATEIDVGEASSEATDVVPSPKAAAALAGLASDDTTLGESDAKPSQAKSKPCKTGACKNKSKHNAKKQMEKASEAAADAARRLGEEGGAKAKTSASTQAGSQGSAYIPLSPTIPKLTVVKLSTVKGLFQVDNNARRQFSVNKFGDVSATPAGAAIFGGNMHVRNVKSKDDFRFSNTHGQMGAIGFAAHYPQYNKASIITSATKTSKGDVSFKPKTVTTFTAKGDVGVGLTGPASRLHVQGVGNTRLINANHWADMSGCATGIGLFAGNAYVTTENNQARFRYANSHSSMGAIGFAVNFPDWNKASIVSSGTKTAASKKAFKPKAMTTFTHDGLVGMGTTRPKAQLDVKSHRRQFSVNDWVDVSSQGSAGFIGLNAHLVLRGSKRFFAYSNTAKNIGAIGVATNFPLINQLSIVASKAASSSKGTLFKPQAIATFTRGGNAGFGTDAPKAKVDVRHATARQISANKYADVSANDQLQGFFGGNGYAVGRQFSFANTHGIVGAVGLATHYPKPGHASIISSANQQPKAGAAFKPKILAQFKPDGSLYIPNGLVVKGDLKVSGRMLGPDDATTREYDFMAAHETLVKENMELRTRLTKLEAMMMTMSTSLMSKA